MRTHDFQIPLNAPDPVPVFSDETTEDLQRDGLRLIQKQSGFRYGEDAVLLAHYAAEHWLCRRRRPPAFVELGSQCGVVSILFAALVPGASGLGLELIDRQVDVMRRNIELNRLTDRLRTVQGDIRALACPGVALPDGLSQSCCDLVICNPPYGVPEQGFPRTDNDQAGYENHVAREEVACNFDEICRLSARLLKQRDFVDRVRALFDELGVSTVLVAGGSGAFFGVADLVIAVNRYVPRDVTQQARTLVGTQATQPQKLVFNALQARK